MIDKQNPKTPVVKSGNKPITLSGSESIARAVIDAGARVAASYPGGPVTAVVDKLIELSASSDLYVEWSNCEKVAFEVALGCSLAGRRSLVAAKHVGINHIYRTCNFCIAVHGDRKGHIICWKYFSKGSYTGSIRASCGLVEGDHCTLDRIGPVSAKALFERL